MTWEEVHHQHKVLTDRYLDCVLGEFQTTLLLILQAPLIAALIAWRFHNVTPTDFLYFSLSLSTLWFGCTNAARELIKERAIFSRERLFGLHIGTYLSSKFQILAVISFVQALLFILVVNYYVALNGFLLFHIGLAFLTILAGVALGLTISSIVGTIHQADALVPIVLIPQILFSPIVMPDTFLRGLAVYFEKLMPLRWSYYAFSEIADKETQLGTLLLNAGILLVMILCLLVVSGFFLRGKKPVF
ncbi:ABC transporter permease [bacterium]|nr:ABC transporter permease [bacterium]